MLEALVSRSVNGEAVVLRVKQKDKQASDVTVTAEVNPNRWAGAA